MQIVPDLLFIFIYLGNVVDTGWPISPLSRTLFGLDSFRLRYVAFSFFYLVLMLLQLSAIEARGLPAQVRLHLRRIAVRAMGHTLTTALFSYFLTANINHGAYPLGLQLAIHFFLVWNTWDRAVMLRCCAHVLHDAEDADEEEMVAQAAKDRSSVSLDHEAEQEEEYVALPSK